MDLLIEWMDNVQKLKEPVINLIDTGKMNGFLLRLRKPRVLDTDDENGPEVQLEECSI